MSAKQSSLSLLASIRSLIMEFKSLNLLDSRAQNKTGRTGRLGMEALSRGALKGGLTNSTREIVDSLVLDKVQQVRYMHIAFGCVSLASAFYIIFRIWYDSWRASKLSVSLRRRYAGYTVFKVHAVLLMACRKFDFLWKLHPAESFPLILGLFILIQQFSFVSIQARALNSVFITDCRVSSQVVFTREFIRHSELSGTNLSDRDLRCWIHPLHLRPRDDNSVIKTHSVCAPT
jgi:hypothetical protein